MFCKRCGNQINPGDNVCSRCGEPVGNIGEIGGKGYITREKTVIGLSVGTLAAITYLMGIFGGYIAMFMITGYIVICEKSDWLRKNALNAILITLFFGIIGLLIGFIPDILSLLKQFVVIFGGELSIPVITQICSFCTSLVYFIEDIVLLVCAYYASKGVAMRIGFIERLF